MRLGMGRSEDLNADSMRVEMGPAEDHRAARVQIEVGNIKDKRASHDLARYCSDEALWWTGPFVFEAPE